MAAYRKCLATIRYYFQIINSVFQWPLSFGPGLDILKFHLQLIQFFQEEHDLSRTHSELFRYCNNFMYTNTHTHTYIYGICILHIYIYSKISQRKEKSVYYGLYVESKKNTKISVYTKQKQTHRHRKQTYGYKRGGEGRWGQLGVWD